MVREQAVLKLPSTEIPLIALDDWRFWVLVVILTFLVSLWLLTRHKKG